MHLCSVCLKFCFIDTIICITSGFPDYSATWRTFQTVSSNVGLPWIFEEYLITWTVSLRASTKNDCTEIEEYQMEGIRSLLPHIWLQADCVCEMGISKLYINFTRWVFTAFVSYVFVLQILIWPATSVFSSFIVHLSPLSIYVFSAF